MVPFCGEKSTQGDSARAHMKYKLESMFPGSSNNIMLWTGDRNWEFSNRPGRELMTLQNVGNAHASNARQHMKENFTLVDLAEKVSTGQLPNENAMNLISNHGPPMRKKIIILACKGDYGGGSGSKKQVEEEENIRGKENKKET